LNSVTFLISLTFVVIMSKEGDLPKLPIKKRKIGTIGGSLIVMGLSLLFIYILWASFGHIGPSFSSDVLNLQQSTLRAQYHLPEKPVITDPTVLQTPPSLRPFLTDNATSGSTNATSGSTNATSGSTNATSGSTNATSGSTNATSGLTDQASGNTQVSIVAGASTLTDRAFSPNVIEITVGQTVVWTNDDNAFHTVTSGAAGDAEAGKEFDSGLTGPTALTSKGKTFEHTFDRIGDYPYFCSLHPAMVGTVIVK
jgi:plastocyanin